MERKIFSIFTMQEISLCGIFFIIKNFCHRAGRQKTSRRPYHASGGFLEMICHVFSCHIFVMPRSYRRRYRSDRLLDHFIFLQELFQICAADFFEDLMQRDLFLEAQVHLGDLFAVAQFDCRVQQVTHIVGAAPDLRYTAVHVEQRVNGLPYRYGWNIRS